MKFWKTVWGSLSSRIWFLVTSVLLALLLVVSLVITQVPIINNTLNIAFGGRRAILSEEGNGIYESAYSSKQEVLAAANKLNEEVVEEGITLLKNEDNVLPLSKNAKVSVFGKNSVDLVYGGTGSGGGDGSGGNTLYESLEAAGIEYNPTLKKFYENNALSGSGRPANPAMGDIISGFATGETPVENYSSVRDSYKDYNDVAIVVISRIGGEGFDLPRSMGWNGKNYAEWSLSQTVPGARSVEDHYLQLDRNETDLLDEVCKNFDNVVVLLNCSQVIELGFLDDPAHYAYHEEIKGALWMGLPGDSGVMAVGRVLTGEVNPSGRTVDTYVRNLRNDPSWNNFGNNGQDGGNTYLDESGKSRGYYYVDYEEGIYVGYRYYETRYATETEPDKWYKENVVYPFGYGLSYTDFEWEIVSSSPESGSEITPETEITIDVKVTNKGRYAGKDVVQLYFTAPYKDGGIEKADKVLVAFVKTDLLAADGGSDTYTLSFRASDMKSYDYNDANDNGFKGYELESGDYILSVSRNAHQSLGTVDLKVSQDYAIHTDDVTDNDVVNHFDDVSAGISVYLSRTDWDKTWPQAPTVAERTVSDEFAADFSYKKDDNGKPWQTDLMPQTGKPVTVSLKELVNSDFDDSGWEQLLDSLTVKDMQNLVGMAAFSTVAISGIDKPATTDADGPSGFTNFMAMSDTVPVYDTCFYAAECVLGATWNVELAEKMGEMVGNEALIGNERDDGMPYTGWYAPAINIHRSAFAGRNWEYYSEDGMLSGALAASVIKGASSKGVITYVKHFALNDQETNRDSNGVMVWANEQAMRELYFKPFEMAVKDGRTLGMMSSFNRIGKTWAGGNYELLTQVLRNEWGFKGAVITDYNLLRYMNQNQMIRAGGDLVLNQAGKFPDAETATDVSLLRRAAKNILYTTAHSNAMDVTVLGYKLPVWQVLLIIVDVVVFAACAVWGAVVFYRLKRKSAGNEVTE